MGSDGGLPEAHAPRLTRHQGTSEGPIRTLAVDWSGSASGSARTIWIAEAVDGELRFLESGRARPEVARFLVDLAGSDPQVVVGLDFAFSLPAWFLRQGGFQSAPELWKTVALEGDRWLAACEPPFWGRPGTRRPDLGQRAHFRTTELNVPTTHGIRPKSVFQVGGAGTVGTGSIRGMSILATLHEAGFSIWPFHQTHLPTVVEIYPRLLTGAVRKSSPVDRRDYLARLGMTGPDALLAIAGAGEDAFDAAVSAFVMSRHAAELSELPELADEQTRLEGAIWFPTNAAIAG